MQITIGRRGGNAKRSARNKPFRQAVLPLFVAISTAISGCSIPSRPPSDRPSRPGRQIYIAATYRRDVVLVALSLLGTEYRYGGDNPEAGLDCSGLVSHVFRTATGLVLPHNAGKIAEVAVKIPREGLAPGDLVFFNTLGPPYSHMGIYVGEGKFLHAPSKGGKVRLDSLSNSYYSTRLSATGTLFVS